MIWYCFFVMLLASSVLSDGESLLEPCSKLDIVCLSHSTEKFLEKTASGIPESGFKAIDPLIIPSLTVNIDESIGLVFHFKDLNITGLKRQIISDFQMNTDEKSVVLKTKADLHIVGLLTLELKKDSKSFSGLVTMDSTVLGAARYNYNLIKDDKDVEFFVVGPETIDCEVLEEPKLVLSSDLQENLDKDPAAKKSKAEYLSKRAEHRKKAMCEITKLAYVEVVHNIRAAAKILPKTAFFKDV